MDHDPVALGLGSTISTGSLLTPELDQVEDAAEAQGVDISIQRYDPRSSSPSLFGTVWRRLLEMLTEKAGVKVFVPKGLDVVVRHYEPKKTEWKFEKTEERPREDDRQKLQQEEREFRGYRERATTSYRQQENPGMPEFFV